MFFFVIIITVQICKFNITPTLHSDSPTLLPHINDAQASSAFSALIIIANKHKIQKIFNFDNKTNYVLAKFHYTIVSSPPKQVRLV